MLMLFWSLSVIDAVTGLVVRVLTLPWNRALFHHEHLLALHLDSLDALCMVTSYTLIAAACAVLCR